MRLRKQEKDEKSCCLQWFLGWEWETGCEMALALFSNCVPREPFCLSAVAFTAALVASHLLCLPKPGFPRSNQIFLQSIRKPVRMAVLWHIGMGCDS